jgi:Basic region leucine zipper
MPLKVRPPLILYILPDPHFPPPLLGSPDYKMRNDFSAYLTSPLDDSPWEDDMLTTPSFGSAGDSGVDILTSPVLLDPSDAFSDMPLFPNVPSFDLTFEKLNVQSPNKIESSGDHMSSSTSHHSLFPDEGSAGTPSRSGSAAPTRRGRRKLLPTGTRKNVTPESLVPVEAPIQPRKYVTSSSTSRKELPVIFARKRKLSTAFSAENEEDQLAGDTLNTPPTPIELDAIDAKRRQNTLAARRSRKRKLEYQLELESAIDDVRADRDAWKTRALALKSLLQDNGVEIPLELEESLDQN